VQPIDYAIELFQAQALAIDSQMLEVHAGHGTSGSTEDTV
jgi:hypothetical protein